MNTKESTNVFVGVKDGLIKPNVIMNTYDGMEIFQSTKVYVDGNYIGVPLGDDGCLTRKFDSNSLGQIDI